MHLTVDSVMQQLTPMLTQTADCRCTWCGDTNPENFNTNKRRCRSCRRDENAQYLLRKQQERDFQKSMETLRIINSFPPRGATP